MTITTAGPRQVSPTTHQDHDLTWLNSLQIVCLIDDISTTNERCVQTLLSTIQTDTNKSPPDMTDLEVGEIYSLTEGNTRFQFRKRNEELDPPRPAQEVVAPRTSQAKKSGCILNKRNEVLENYITAKQEGRKMVQTSFNHRPHL